jgi:hypothetical protein
MSLIVAKVFDTVQGGYCAIIDDDDTIQITNDGPRLLMLTASALNQSTIFRFRIRVPRFFLDATRWGGDSDRQITLGRSHICLSDRPGHQESLIFKRACLMRWGELHYRERTSDSEEFFVRIDMRQHMILNTTQYEQETFPGVINFPSNQNDQAHMVNGIRMA